MPFAKGQSGNPGGRGTSKPWRAALDKALAKREKNKGPQALERVADACVNAAIAGDVAAIREVAERLDGKTVQANTHSGPDGDAIPIKAEVVFVTARSSESS